MSYKRSISKIKFGILSPEIIRKLSVAEIQTPDTYDEDGVPIPTGVMDPRLGTLEPGQRCQTCGNTYLGCPGHFGHIELPTPVIHVGFTKTILTLLRATCRSCGRILLNDEEIKDYKEKLKRYEEGGISSRQTYYKIIQKAISMNSCPHCGEKQYKIELEKPTTFKEQTEYGTVKLGPSIVRARLERIPDDDLILLNIDPKNARPEWMVITVLPVPPVYVRPSITLESGYRSEDDLTHKLVDIIRVAQRLKESISAGSPSPIVAELSDLLQYHVTTYINNEALGISPSRHRSGRILKTLAQRLKGKEGRFRLNLSGKRVDFSSRTVVSPDPNLSINEVGVPLEVAKQLTVPEKVTSWNIEKLREYVRNGPDKYPGARYIIRPDGKRIRLKYISNLEELANALEPGFIVERHLIDGDIVLFNRQPSLHRMSIMAHLVKVLPYRTFRLNLTVCPPYNADFDGDEMNLHVPQSEEAQVEARFLLLVQNNIISPRYGAPIIGAIRDFLTSAYLLTKKDTLLSKDEVSTLCVSINYDGDLPEPIIKSPEPKWSGKQIFSLLLPKDFNHELESSFEDEKQVIIKNGQLISGVLDRNSIGIEKTNSILHVLAKEYGPFYVKDFLDKLCRLLNTFITIKGFTFSLDDLQVPEETYKEVKNILNEMDQEYQKIVSIYKDYEKLFESNVLSIVSKARSKAGKIIRSVIPPSSSALIMAKTGARGTSLNIDQMVATVGQQSVRRERIKRGFDGRVLSFFMKGDSSIIAKGFVYNSFIKGLDPIEFFFHAAGGRDGLVDTAVRTQQSGYMQRRLINALESLYIEYDGTVRIAEDKKIIQFQYGEDGIDPSKTYHGKPINFEILIRNALEKFPDEKPFSKNLIESKIEEIKNLLPQSIIDELKENLSKRKIGEKTLNEIINSVLNNYENSKAEPGDAVGIITAQSIGEPSTQLTLRTFHFAGVMERSILLGLPRLIEIVDARKVPSTPAMTIYLDEKSRFDEKKAEKISKRILYTTFSDIISESSIHLGKKAVILKLDINAIKNFGVTLKDIKEALKENKFELKGKMLYIYSLEEDVSTLQKFRDKILRLKLKGIKGITRTIVKKEDNEYVILTEGSNLKEVMNFPCVDPKRVVTNNIHEIADVLGIEAARTAIIKEAKSVLKEQGIDVDVRHLLLLADMMTVSGKVQQVGRHGVIKLKSSVLARAAFEISTQTLLDAAVKGEIDNLKGNVERILIGKEIPVGTGTVSLLMKLSDLNNKAIVGKGNGS